VESHIFILKTHKNSGTKVKQRTQEIELDLIVVFQLLKAQVKAKKPHG
jgi:hypothetical protein